MFMANNKAIQQLDLNLLKIFESLYVEQNMTRTAEVLHITPSAVSHAMKRLRDCLGDPLFQRSQNKMVPTPACQRMAPEIIDNLSRLRQILQLWGEFEPTTSRHHFRIGMHDALELTILPRLAKQFVALAPHITFSSIKVERQYLSRELSAGQIDVAIDVGLPIKSPVLHQKLIDDNFAVMMRDGHPLKGQLNRNAYFNARHLSVSNRPSGPAVEDLLLQELGFERDVAVRCQNFYVAKEMLKDSDNLLTLPHTMAQQFCGPSLTIEELPFTLPKISTHMYWHENTQQDAALSWLRKVLTDQFTR